MAPKAALLASLTVLTQQTLRAGALLQKDDLDFELAHQTGDEEVVQAHSMRGAGMRVGAKPALNEQLQDAKKIDCDSLKHVPSDVTGLYINLDSRTDRKKSFTQDMEAFMEPFERCKGWTLNRFSAVSAQSFLENGQTKSRHTGQVAAASSHVAALKQAEKTTKGPVMIFEDDFHFEGTPASLVQRIDSAFKGLDGNWDVLMMGDSEHHQGADDKRLEKYQIRQTEGAWCSEAYIVNKKYLPKLLKTTGSGLSLMEKGGEHVHPEVEPMGAAYDTLWYPLQKDEKAKWIVFRPKIGGQANTWGDSNID